MAGKLQCLERNDYASLSIFLAEQTEGIFKSEFWLERFKCWWDNNAAQDDNIARGWVIKDNQGRIKGFLGNIASRYIINKEERIACSATTWYVDQGYRTQSLDLFRTFIKQKNPLLDTTPTERVAHILSRLRFFDLSQEWLAKEAIYPCKLDLFYNLLIDKSNSKKSLALLLRFLKAIIIFILGIYQKINKTRVDLNKPTQDYKVKEIRKFSDSYSSLWNKLKYKYKIAAVRDAERLNWFFFGSEGLARTRRVFEVSKGQDLFGYAAVKLATSHLNGKIYPYFEVVDIFLSEEEPKAYLAIFKELLVIGQSSDKEITYLRTHIFNKSMEKAIRKFGFLRQVAKAKFLYRGFAQEALKEADNISKDFYATALDGDRCFFP